MDVLHLCWPMPADQPWISRLCLWVEPSVASLGDGAIADTSAEAGAARSTGNLDSELDPNADADADPDIDEVSDSRLTLEGPLTGTASPSTSADATAVLTRDRLAMLRNIARQLDPAGEVTSVRAVVPVIDGQLLPSPQACEDFAPDPARVSLAEAAFDVLPIDLDRALDLVLGVPEGGLVTIGQTRYRPAADLLWWRACARLAQMIVDRERYVPALQEMGSELHAWWSPLLNEPTIARVVVKLGSSMPPAALLGQQCPPGLSAAVDASWVTQRFLSAATDALVRRQVREVEDRHNSEDDLPVGPALSAALFAKTFDLARLRVEPQMRAQLLRALPTWTQQLFERRAELRLCLELVPPESESAPQNGAARRPSKDAKSNAGKWWLGFFLQPLSDPSLLISAKDIWQGTSDTLTTLRRLTEDPQETLLAELGRARRLCPLLETALQDRKPEGCWLPVEQAHRFLKDHAMLLQEAGVVVRMPAWWTGDSSAAQLSIKLHVEGADGAPPPPPVDESGPGDSGRGQLTLNTLVRFNWTVALGDWTLTPAEFERLVAMKSPLVHVRGQWVELSETQMQTMRKLLNGNQPRTGTLRDALQIGLGAMDDELFELDPAALADGLKFGGLSAGGWIAPHLEQMLGGQPASLSPVDPPETFVGNLRPYQRVGLSWLVFLRRVGLGALLADDMGLGKTIQMLAALLHWKKHAGQGHPPGPTLLIAPTSVVANWRREAERFAPSLRVLVHQGPNRLKGTTLAAAVAEVDLILTSYALVQRDRAILEPIAWSTVVLDEAQAIKNTTAKTTQAVRQLNADYRVALTGTPVENRLSELWSICEFLNPGYLGTAARFRQAFILPIERTRSGETTGRLRQLVAPILLRRVKTDQSIITDLPEKIETTVYCKLTSEQAALYEAIVQDSLTQIAGATGIARKGSVLAAIMRLKQVCNHPAQYLRDGSPVAERSGKMNRLVEMLEEILDDGDRALLFTQFTEFGQIVRNFLEERFGREVLFLHGGTPPTVREKLVERFQSGVEELQSNPDGPPMFVLSLKAGGTGLNLTAANHVFHLDRWWNPAVENQATDRAFRIGQRRTVQVHKFVCEGTLEERIDQMLDTKRELAEAVMTSGEEWITQMSTDQLRELFALRETALE